MKIGIRLIVISLFLLFSHLMFGQNTKFIDKRFNAEKLNGVYIPQNLEDCFVQIDEMLSDSLKTEFKKVSEKKFMSMTHFGLGMWIRNNWNLWKGSRLTKYFNEKGIYHPDDMSGIILTSYHRKLTQNNIDFENQINYSKTYWIVAQEPKRKNYPIKTRKIEFGTKLIYTLKENNLPGMLHVQSNSKTDKVWIYDYHFGWRLIDEFELEQLKETNLENREEAIKKIYSINQ